MKTQITTQIKEQIGTHFKTQIKTVVRYWFFFIAAFIFWELMLRIDVSGGISPDNLWLLAFIPAEALIPVILCGWFGKRSKGRFIADRVIFVVVTALFAFYYIVQLVYSRVFGSLFSVSLLGMGNDAMGDFGWTINGVLIGSIGMMIVFCIPVFAAIAVGFFSVYPKDNIKVAVRIGLIPLVVLVWFGGLLFTRIGGTQRNSAYNVFHDTMLDTDTTAAKIGALTTTVVETGSYVFGIGIGGNNSDGDADLSDVSALTGSVQPVKLAEKNESTAEKGKEDNNTSSSASADNNSEDMESAEQTEPEVIPPEQLYNILPWIDFEALSENAPDADTKALCDMYAVKAPDNKNEYTGRFEGCNLIYICAESFWSYAVDEKATPTLYKLANNGIVLDNYYNSFKNTTTNGEYALVTSLWPDVSRNAKMGKDVGSFPQSASKYMPMGLGNLFKKLGVTAHGYHNYKGSYYSRDKSLPNLGYTCKFLGSGMRFTSAWPASDLEMLQQSVDDYINDDVFHAYYMTFSGHGPYDDTNNMYLNNIDFVREVMADKKYPDEALGYLACNRELDLALEYLLNRLEEAGKLDKTVIVLAGDHYPYYLSASSRKAMAGHSIDEDFGIYASTCIIYNAGMEAPLHVDEYCCNVDILPTILNLFNIPYDSRLLAGTDIFSDSLHKAMLYNKSFITENVKYNATSGKTEWLIDTSAYTEEQLQEYLDSIINIVAAEYSASLKMQEVDFYKYVWSSKPLSSSLEGIVE